VLGRIPGPGGSTAFTQQLPITGTATGVTLASMSTAAWVQAGEQGGAVGERALRRPDGSAIRVLVVDDESSLSDLLSMALRYEGWEVRTAADGGSAVRAAREFRPDAVVLDVMLPDFDGLEVLRRMRSDTPDVPVLFLTARDAVEDRVAGLTAGGDDYVTKPFSLEELVARLRGLLRRSGISSSATSSWTRTATRCAAPTTSSS
jgi:CheY-like chemotaxis protein